ncbi:MAG: carbamoyl-phosphate synthase large subunit [Candidatus Rokubacteria bacterium]|nr:carbamoyl-phosphate synthase large subunit [Candidatus Rokubacteria bacterium]
MPRRTDIEKILLIGSGPIVIGQACEFDYSGTQACKALKEEGFEVILVNSNPATIMTDPEMADRTYIEPLTPEMVAKVIARERPQALLPTLGGQTGLNLAVALAEQGTLDQYGVELIGAKLPAIKKAEDRELFKEAMQAIGLEVPQSGYAKSLEDAREVVRRVGYPVIIRPSFTLGGTGGSIAYNPEELEEAVRWGLQTSPLGTVLVEESVIGWKEFELEVMRDGKDNVVIICSIENFDPMGIHTGDSITVAPAQTLSDKEYQLMRDAAIAIIREIGVETGGSNIQFAVNPDDGRLVVIEMNPRVSRSSALASKATGFPIAKIAAKLAVGYTLDEIRNDITRETPASFEPTIDYCVVKFPRWAFEKFPEADQTLTTQMKSVGEAMAIGRTFKEALQKAIRSLEQDRWGLTLDKPLADLEELRAKLRVPNAERAFVIAEAYRRGMATQDIYALTRIDPWFLENMREIVAFEPEIADRALGEPRVLRRAKQLGFADTRIARLTGSTEAEVRALRKRHGITATFKTVDTCAAEFVAHTPYLYSTYEEEDEAPPTDRKKVIILGSGPNRIGQGIEFDYCCVHAAFALREQGVEAIMVNCNPETVSTDYDTSDRLYFEPLTKEDVIRILQEEKPDGVIVQFGGQTPLKLAVPLEKWGANILGTSPDSIDIAEDRERFAGLLRRLNIRQPENGIAKSHDEAITIARRIGYPILARPSYVLGGRAMEIVYDEKYLRHYMETAVQASEDRPVLIDRYLEGAIEVDVDALCDGKQVVIGGIMEHIEHAGVHSGDSACCMPPHSLSADVIDEITRQTKLMALELRVKGLMNVQYAVKEGKVYVLEVNPRASRTVPFVSKAIGIPLAKIAAKIMIGKTLKELGFEKEVTPPYRSVKEAVFPFAKFPGVDTLLGPEMNSTGEVMGIDPQFGMAFAKSQTAAGTILPKKGAAFVSVRDRDKADIAPVAKKLVDLGFSILATRGTASFLKEREIPVEVVNKVHEGSPHIVDRLEAKEVAMLINTHEGKKTAIDSYSIRRTALIEGVPYFTTVAAARAATEGIEELSKREMDVTSLQDYRRITLAAKTNAA